MSDEDIHLSLGDKVKAIWLRVPNYCKSAADGIKAKPDRLNVYNSNVKLSSTLMGVQPNPAIDPQRYSFDVP